MPAFTRSEVEFVNKSYEQASSRIENLTESNLKRESEIRKVAIDTLQAHQEQIENLGFFEKENFSPEEIKAILEAASAISATEDGLEDTHEITLMELESDLAELVQKLGLNEYLFMLKLHWIAAKRYARLPDEIPEEVRDEFNVGVFNKTQGRLNQIAFSVQDVSRLKCLNNDDYAPAFFTGAVLNAGKYSAQEAIDNYIALQRFKEAERAAKEASEVSIGGQIWAVVGWDSPWDFVLDIGLAVVTGGASKVIKWGVRLNKARKRATIAAKKLEKVLDIQNRVRKMEHRAKDIRNAAERLKKAKNILELPKKIAAAFKELNKARSKTKLLEMVGSQVTKDYIRVIASSLTAKGLVTGSAQVGKAATKELARRSIIAYLDGTPLGKEIKELRAKNNLGLIIVSGFNSRSQERLMTYFGLLITREFLARMIIMFVHKRSLSAENVVNEFIDSAALALEIVLLDVPVIAEAQLKMLGRTIMSTIRAILAEIGKGLAKNLIAA